MSLRIYRRVKKWDGDRVVECRAVSVYDGDGFLAAGSEGKFMVRIWGIDAPEYGQELFEESRAALRAMVRGERLWCSVVCVDRYGRRVCRVRMLGGVDVGLGMVCLGWAYWYRSFACRDAELRLGEMEARARGLGIWGRACAELPWTYRRRNRESISQSRAKRWPGSRR